MSLPGSASASTYGGANLVDYAGQGVTDPTTDRAASAVNPLVSDVAGMTHTAARAWVQFTPSGTASPALTAYDATWNWPGNTNAEPTVARNSTGLYTITWPVSIYDAVPSGAPGYAGAITLAFRSCASNNVYASSEFFRTYIVGRPAANSVQVAIEAGGALTDATAVSFDVWFY